MTMADDSAQRAADAQEHVKIYKGVMKASGEFGVPFSLGLTAFFANLVMRNGIGMAIVAFILVYVFSWWVVRTFFSH